MANASDDNMTRTGDNGLTDMFVARQRERLETLYDQILHSSTQAAAEERDLSQRHGSEVQDSGDEGAIEARRRAADAFNADGRLRLARIRRALEKMDEGSYGLSDESGEPIPRARLEAIPEARYTVEEAELLENRTAPPERPD